MNALTRLERFDEMFPDFFRRFARPLQTFEGVPGDIRLDITEHDKDDEVRAEIPGARKDDIRVSVDGNFVSIAAEVKHEREQQGAGGKVLLRETGVGSASRGFSLGHEIDVAGVVATLEDGVLKLTLPKREGSGSRTVPIL